jgi:hypothetical protein
MKLVNRDVSFTGFASVILWYQVLLPVVAMHMCSSKYTSVRRVAEVIITNPIHRPTASTFELRSLESVTRLQCPVGHSKAILQYTLHATLYILGYV